MDGRSVISRRPRLCHRRGVETTTGQLQFGESMPHTMLESWHDFFTLVGASAATLVGLMFVAASVGTGLFTGEKEIGLRTFLSPTVVAFGVVLASCVVGVLPSPNSSVPAALV